MDKVVVMKDLHATTDIVDPFDTVLLRYFGTVVSYQILKVTLAEFHDQIRKFLSNVVVHELDGVGRVQ